MYDDYPEDYDPTPEEPHADMYPFAGDTDDGGPMDCQASYIVDQSLLYCCLIAGHPGPHVSMGGQEWDDDDDGIMGQPEPNTVPCSRCGDPYGECDPGRCILESFQQRDPTCSHCHRFPCVCHEPIEPGLGYHYPAGTTHGDLNEPDDAPDQSIGHDDGGRGDADDLPF